MCFSLERLAAIIKVPFSKELHWEENQVGSAGTAWNPSGGGDSL